MINSQDEVFLERLVNQSDALQVIHDVRKLGLRWNFCMELTDEDTESMRKERVKHMAEMFGIDAEQLVTNERMPHLVEWVYHGDPQGLLKRPGFNSAQAYFFTSRRVFVNLKPQGEDKQDYLVQVRNPAKSIEFMSQRSPHPEIRPRYARQVTPAREMQEKLVERLRSYGVDAKHI